MARNKGHSLYFVCILPSDEVGMQITALKQEIASNYGSSYALRLPPHITLMPPFEYPDNDIITITDCLNKALWGLNSFNIDLHNFGCFGNRVIYVDVVMTAILQALYASVINNFKELGKNIDAGRQFSPHMTIANRDLTHVRFAKAWPAFENRKFSASFAVEGIHLLKHIDGRWQLFHQSPLP